ncbi:hypothetical protein ACFFGV_16230 [Pontibacillus salicampi]|uniref:Uncharacterized protein n=1 Tax=Pontibacillus salicampi TaxID=1449801 RepID=A0ABV6LRT7_9BACI
MKRKSLYILLMVSICTLLAGWSKPEEQQNALWVEDTDLSKESYRLLKKSSNNDISLIYLEINSERSASFYKDFVASAHEKGIEVHAYNGKPEWALKDQKQSVLDFSEWVMNYNNSVSEQQQMDGIHLKIQPHYLPEWYEDSESVIKQWQENVTAFQQNVKDTSLETSATIPFWLDTIQTPGQSNQSFNTWMIEKFDHTTILAYRDTLEGGNGIVSLIEDELEIASNLNKKMIVGVTLQKGNENHVTFHEEGFHDMMMHLNVMDKHMKDIPSYIGHAIENYQHWTQLEGNPASEPPKEGETSPEDEEKYRGTYIWHAENLIEEPDKILSFAKEHDLNLIYARLDRQQDFAAYTDFVEKAHEQGIEVHAMGGHPTWALEKGKERLSMFIDYVTTYNKKVEKPQKFDGIHLDIEPYVLQEWYDDESKVMKSWRENISFYQKEVKANSNLKTGVDLAMWLDDHPISDDSDMSISKWMIDKVDHTTIMAFRDFAEGSGGIIDTTKEEVAFGDELGKELVIAVEMKENKNTPYISFYEEGKGVMEEELNIVDSRWRNNSSYLGHAVHSYDYWKEAKE